MARTAVFAPYKPRAGYQITVLFLPVLWGRPTSTGPWSSGWGWLLLGHFLVYALTVYHLQYMNSSGWALSIGELLTFWNGENRVLLRRFIGLLTLFFLSFYAAAQLKAGGMALEVALGQPLYVGILLSTAIILFYCWSGGIRASIWTDSSTAS